MARFRQDFVIISRSHPPSNKYPEGLRVFAYRTYAPDGTTTVLKSTGIRDTGKPSDRLKAERYCMELLKTGRLYRAASMRFEAFAAGWFIPGKCAWLADRIAAGAPDRPAISASYLKSLQMCLRLYLLPILGPVRLEDLRPSTIKSLRVKLQGMDLSNKTINQAADTLRVMTDWALADGLLLADPFRGVKRFQVAVSNRRAFTLDEAKVILGASWRNRLAWLFTLTGAVTGMRLSEIRAIRAETLHPDHIDVHDQFNRDRLTPIKTKEARKVPIPPSLYALLAPEVAARGYAFALSLIARAPMSRNAVIEPLALLATKGEGLCFHSWRHFFNTWLMAENVPPAKVRAVMGHSEGRGAMTDLYTDWTPEMFPEVYAAQGKLMGILGPDRA